MSLASFSEGQIRIQIQIQIHQPDITINACEDELEYIEDTGAKMAATKTDKHHVSAEEPKEDADEKVLTRTIQFENNRNICIILSVRVVSGISVDF